MIEAALTPMAAELGQGVYESLPYVLFFSIAFFASTFTVPKHLGLDTPTVQYWASSVVSTLHSFIIVPLGYQAMEPFWWSDDLTLTTEASHRAINVFVGYILADSLPLLWNRNRWSGSAVYLWHHGAAFLCWSLIGTRGHGHAIAIGLLLCEATSPFVNGRWFMATMNKKDGLLYYANGAAMTLSFFALRIAWMGWLIFRNLVVLRTQFLALPNSTIAVVFFGVVVGYPLQIMWFQKIVSGLIKVLGGGKPEASKAKRDARGGKRSEAFPVGASEATDKSKVQ